MITRRIFHSVAAAALLLFSGCFLEERMFWSPDGQRAAVCLPEGLCLMDTNGNVSAPLLSEVTFAAWLPGSQGLVALRRLAATNWQEISRLISREERATVEGLALGLPGLINGALAATGGDISSIDEKFFKPLKFDLGPAFIAGLICLRDTQPEIFSNLVARAKDGEQLQKDLANDALVHEISVLRLDGDRLAGQPVVLERTLAEVAEPRPSPSARVVAFLREGVLIIVPLDGGSNRLAISDHIVGSFDWTPDGKALVYPTAVSGDWERGAVNLAHIQRRVVVGPGGQPSEGESVLLATGAFPFTPRVRSLPDGRVLFASQPLQLPLGAQSTSETRLYIIDPAKGTNAVPIPIRVPTGTLPDDLAGFAVSPDGRRLAIGEYGSDSIAVLEIATGRIEVVSPNRGARNRTMPAWRGSDELYFAALPEAGARRPEWFRWRNGSGPVNFSATWPDAAVQNLLELAQ